MLNNVLILSSSPHVKTHRTTKKIMIDVCIALLPTSVMGVIFFGLRALALLLIATSSAVIAEYLYLLIAGKSLKEITRQFDFSSCVTGLLIGLTLGVNYPLYTPIFGSFFAIIVVKMLFGGTGKNLVNPAIVGRVFIVMSFQSVVTPWLTPSGTMPVAGASVLTNMLATKQVVLSNWELFLGYNLEGCIGETCKLALLIGAVYLAVRKVTNVFYPLLYIGVCGLFTVALNDFDFGFFLPSILSGGLFLGALFMSNDYTTTPNTFKGNIIYFVLLGLLTAGLRQATGMEVVSFAILLMNLLVPLIDKFIIQKPFGYQKPKKEKTLKQGEKING